jgi:serine/threonine-protein kinase HipA
VPGDDLATFMRANIVFWLLGAADSHAKNFSIFLTSGGQFRMTPLYDVLSAQPSLDANQIQRKQFRLAMSVGKSRHYAMSEILPRHFIQTAETAGVGPALVRSIFKDLAENAEQAIGAAIDELPGGFPESMTNSIRAAMSHRIDLLKAD